MTETLPQPASREEEYLATIAGMTGIELPIPASRKEEYLNAIAQNGGGGGGGGTTNFNDLTNRPKYKGSAMTSTTDIPEIAAGTALSSTYSNGTLTINGTVPPTISMTSTDPGEGGTLAADNYIFVYEA